MKSKVFVLFLVSLMFVGHTYSYDYCRLGNMSQEYSSGACYLNDVEVFIKNATGGYEGSAWIAASSGNPAREAALGGAKNIEKHEGVVRLGFVGPTEKVLYSLLTPGSNSYALYGSFSWSDIYDAVKSEHIQNQSRKVLITFYKSWYWPQPYAKISAYAGSAQVAQIKLKLAPLENANQLMFAFNNPSGINGMAETIRRIVQLLKEAQVDVFDHDAFERFVLYMCTFARVIAFHSQTKVSVAGVRKNTMSNNEVALVNSAYKKASDLLRMWIQQAR